MLEFIQENLNYKLLAIIVLSGIFITKFTKEIKVKTTYKVLIASMFFSSLFYLIEGCGIRCLNNYLFTYLFATSFYELILKIALKKIKNLQ